MRVGRVGMTYLKVRSRYWSEHTYKNCRNVTLGGVSVEVVIQTKYLAITSFGVYRCISSMLIIVIVINILYRTLTPSQLIIKFYCKSLSRTE